MRHTALVVEAYAPPSRKMRAAHVDEPAVAGGAVLVAHARGVAVDVAEERLLPPVEHLHRPPGAQREQAGVDLHREVLAPAERPAHAGQREPDLVVGQAEAAAIWPRSTCSHCVAT